ncbi:MAG: hypothetical protein ACI9GO_000528 [Bacteroidia bacterium]|jgi:hypothetical protein
MKKTITLLVTGLILMAAEVQASRLFLTTNTFRSTAHVSGQQHFSHDGVFQISQLPPGTHFVSITQQSNAQHNRNGRGNNNGNIFRGKIAIPEQSDVYARVNSRGELIIDRVVPHRRSSKANRCDYGPRRGRGTNYGSGIQQYDTRGTRGGTNTPIHRKTKVQSNLHIALRMISQTSFDSEKRTIAKQYLRNNNITSQGVLKMIRMFDFESSRLAIAKLAYQSTVDPKNYFVVNQGFQFSSSSRAINRYIH